MSLLRSLIEYSLIAYKFVSEIFDFHLRYRFFLSLIIAANIDLKSVYSL